MRPRNEITLDFTGFYSRYDNLVGAASPPGFAPGLAPTPSVVSFTAANNQRADFTGVEASAIWFGTDAWRLQGSYSILHTQRRPDPTDEKRDAAHLATLRSSWDLPGDVEFDIIGRYVDRLLNTELDGSTTRINSYLNVDVRLGWRPTENLELSVVGQNLIESRRTEFTRNRVGGSEATPVPRGVYAMMSVNF